MKSLTKLERIYLAIWKKALRSGETLEIETPTMTMAVSSRIGLFRAASKVRRGLIFDEEALRAIKLYTVKVQRLHEDNSKPAKILVVKKQLEDFFEKALEDLGIDDLDLLTEEERLTDDTFIQPPRTPNPFYERD